jgi:hypothetical protein
VRRFIKLASRKYARGIQLVRSTIRKENDLRVEQVLGIWQRDDLQRDDIVFGCRIWTSHLRSPTSATLSVSRYGSYRVYTHIHPAVKDQPIILDHSRKPSVIAATTASHL